MPQTPPSGADADRSGDADEQLLSEAQRERLRLARSAFGLFAKAIKAIRLYVGKGPHVERFRGEFFHELQAYVLQHGELRVEVAPDALLLDGHAALTSDAEEGDDLLYALYREGVREIAFLPGISADEIAVFFELLVHDVTGDERRPDDDRATLLWAADLQYVRLRLADLLTTGAYFVRNPSYRKQFAQRVQRLVQRAAPALVPLDAPRPAGSAAVELAVEAEHDPLLAGFPGFALDEALTTPDEHRAPLGVRALLDDDAARQAERFVEVLCEAMSTVPARAERARAAEHVTRLLEDLMAAQDLSGLAAAVSVLRAHCLVRDATRDVRQAFVAEALAPLARYHRLILLRPALLDGRREDLDRLMGFFELLPRTELEGLVGFLTKLGEGPATRPLRELLERRGADMTAFHVTRLKSENVLVVLESLRALTGNAKADAVVRAQLDNRNPSVRRQALLAMKGRWSTEVMTDALRFLQSDEVGMRLAALEVAAAARDPEMVEPLRTIAERPDFARRDADERRHHVSALLACDPAAALPWARAQLARRNLFARRQAQALQEGVVLALLEHDDPDALQALAEWVSGEPTSSPLRQQVEPVLAARLAEEDERRQEAP